MATSEKTKKTTSKVTKPANTTAPAKEAEAKITVDNEKEELKKQLAEMKAQMELMAKMITSSKTEVHEEIKTNSNRPIRFVNLTNGELILKGTQIWEINGLFAERTFLEREARIILNNMGNLIASGMVYIADAKFVEENDLGEIYLNILSDKDLKNLLNREPSYIIEAFKTTSDGQKKVIIDMIRENKAKGIEVDANILVTLGKLSGQDLLSEE